MDEYRLQTELNDEMRREMALYAEKYEIQAEVQNQKQKIVKRLITYTKVFSLLLLANALLSFIWQRPPDFFVVLVYGVAYLIEIGWLMLGLWKQQRKLVEWQEIIIETEMQSYTK